MQEIKFIIGDFDQLLSLLIFIILNIFFFRILFIKLEISLIRGYLIFAWHSFFSLIFVWYSLTYVADSLSYYEEAVYGNILLDQTKTILAIVYINKILVNYFNLAYLGVFLFYNIIGTIAILLIDSSLSLYIKTKNKFIFIVKNLIVFSPSLHFWSANIGKDAFGMFSVSCILWLYAYNKNKLWYILPTVTLFLFRPQHFAIFSLAALLTFIFLKPKNLKGSVQDSILIKVLIFIIFSIIAYHNRNEILALARIGITIDSFFSLFTFDFYTELSERLKTRQSLPDYLGGGHIDFSKIYLLTGTFTYVFRPLPYEVTNLFMFAASVENSIFLSLTIFSIYCFCYNPVFDNRKIFYLFIFLTSIIPVSVLTPNFGIAARQKWLILLPMLIFFVSVIDNYFQKIERDKEI